MTFPIVNNSISYLDMLLGNSTLIVEIIKILKTTNQIIAIEKNSSTI